MGSFESSLDTWKLRRAKYYQRRYNEREMKRLMIIIPSLGGGGAERVVINLLKGLDMNEFLVTLVVYESDFAYPLPDTVDVAVLDIHSGGNILTFIKNFVNKIISIARFIKKNRPDIVFSLISSTNVTVVLARWLSGIPCNLILSERSHPSETLKNSYYDRTTAYLMKHTYPKVEKIIAVSEEIQQDLIRNFNVPPGKVKVIYNPVDIREIETLSHEEVDHIWFRDKLPIIVSVGRLTRQKGYSYLIKAFSIVRKSVPCRLLLIGEGEEREELTDIAKSSGIENYVEFIGFQKNPYKYMARSSVFVLSSVYEGLPNVILEAMVLGLPVVATNCPSGPAEIIEDRKNGLLVPVRDEKALADVIVEVLTNDELRSELSRAAKMRAQSFALDRVIEQYRGVFLEYSAPVI